MDGQKSIAAAKWAFIETEEGVPVSKHVCDEMGETARRIFEDLKRMGCAPDISWGKHVGQQAYSHFCQEMEAQHFVLRLADTSWKSNQIAIFQYPSWYNARFNHSNAVPTANHDDSDVELDECAISCVPRTPTHLTAYQTTCVNSAREANSSLFSS